MAANERINARVRVHWRVAVRHDQRPLLYGETVDVSANSITMVAEKNVVSGSVVALYIQIPPKTEGQPLQVVEAKARVQYTAYSAGHDAWRMGIQLLDFVGQSKSIYEAAVRRIGT